MEDPYPFPGRQDTTTTTTNSLQQPNGFFDSYFVSYTAAKIAGWGSPAGPYHPGPPHMSHHPVGGMKDGPPGYPPHPQLMDMYSGVSPATAINTMDWKNTSQVGTSPDNPNLKVLQLFNPSWISTASSYLAAKLSETSSYRDNVGTLLLVCYFSLLPSS